MKKLTHKNLNIAYRDLGIGDPIIFAHCSSGSHLIWMPLAEQLASQFQLFLPDLIGYGQSDSWPNSTPYDAEADAEIILALLQKAGRPAHVIAHSYGAAMALRAAIIDPALIRSLHLIEPVAFSLLEKFGHEKEWEEISAIGSKVIHYCEHNQKEKASEIFINYWSGRFAWKITGDAQKKEIINSIDKVAKEFSILTSNNLTKEDYQNLYIETHLFYGDKTQESTSKVTHSLFDLLPNATLTAIPGAGHMSPLSHRSIVNKLLIDSISKIGE